MQPSVSVVIPHFNRPVLLHQALKSLQNQELDQWEAIVVDDGSTADQWASARDFPDIRIRFMERTDGPKGPSRCRNIGIAAATSSYVVFLDSDDLMAPWCLKHRVDFMQENPGAESAVFPVALFSKVPGDTPLMWNRLEGGDDLTRFLRSDPPWHTSSPIWRRSVLSRLDGFNEAVMYGDDSDLHTRALLGGVAFQKQSAAVPDIFVRRDLSARITNTVTEQLLDSRLVRLQEGTRVVRRHGSPAQQAIWEGQYFVECEYLLFNVPGSKHRQVRVLTEWERHSAMPSWYRWVAKLYLLLARVSKNRAYWLLRGARRAAMVSLPSTFFPKGGEFQSAVLSDVQRELIRRRLDSSSVG